MGRDARLGLDREDHGVLAPILVVPSTGHLDQWARSIACCISDDLQFATSAVFAVFVNDLVAGREDRTADGKMQIAEQFDRAGRVVGRPELEVVVACVDELGARAICSDRDCQLNAVATLEGVRATRDETEQTTTVGSGLGVIWDVERDRLRCRRSKPVPLGLQGPDPVTWQALVLVPHERSHRECTISRDGVAERLALTRPKGDLHFAGRVDRGCLESHRQQQQQTREPTNTHLRSA
jgi:hypothetical protein